MKRILIANRGEIACRIIQCCKKLNIHSIAVYSDIDKNSKHVRLANEAIHIGPSKAKESYLSTKNILDAALKTNADAIHPGYGFLAENDQFAKKIIDSDIVWIGPTPETIISMGNKETARTLAVESGVPICPGINQNELEEEDLEEKCKKIGFPILVKASAGGGGIGMQIAKDYNQLKEVIEKTKNLAEKAFGNSDIFLEKYIANARHIEIQIFGYGEKKAIHLYERDCSLQRRFQKIIEESPAPNIERETINQMSECAVNFSSNQKYEGAGTVEFVYDVDNKKFYFLEMNTRIQVEHPVTEQITGLDLVEMQIKFALKINDFTMQQNEILRSGHAIECRLYAEDPSKNFLPSPGKISKLSIPKLTSTDRLDIGVDEGDEISFYYDPMVAKVITQGENRDDSINNMIQLLNEIEIEGQSGGGMITAKVNGHKELITLNIDPEILTEDKEMIEDLIVAAVNQAIQNAGKTAEEKMNSITGGMAGKMKFPGM